MLQLMNWNNRQGTNGKKFIFLKVLFLILLFVWILSTVFSDSIVCHRLRITSLFSCATITCIGDFKENEEARKNTYIHMFTGMGYDRFNVEKTWNNLDKLLYITLLRDYHHCKNHRKTEKNYRKISEIFTRNYVWNMIRYF